MPDTIIQIGDMKFRVVPGWPNAPEADEFVEVAGVAVDSQDNVYVFNRGRRPMAVFRPDGRYLTCWGGDVFVRAHNVTIGPDDSIYAVDVGNHAVYRMSQGGPITLTLGTPGEPSDTGVTSDYRTIRYGGPPFNQPTKAVLNADGDIFVSDGYRNARVHRFTADGTLVKSWGEPGTGPGQFNLSHALAILPDGRVIVCDRENSRMQLFTQDGEFLEQWTDVSRPCDVYVGPDGLIYIAELGHKAGLALAAPTDDPKVPNLSVWTADHRLIGRWGGDDITEPGNFFAPHGIAIDSHGSMYVAEVTVSGEAGRGILPKGYRTIQKFERVS